jgi:hypothetical protein
LLFIFELAVIHDLADRRICVRGNLDQIKTSLLCHIKGARRGYDTDVLTFCTDEADFRGPDAIVDPGASVALRRRVMRTAGYWNAPYKTYNSVRHRKAVARAFQAAIR